jgi:REP element-mobilizing transposase RayT
MTDEDLWAEPGHDSGGRRTRRPRLGGFDYVGRQTYHLVSVTQDRIPVLVRDVASQVVRDLDRAAGATAFALLVYVIMPDHVHVLAQGTTDDAHAVRFVQRFKQLSGHRYAQQCGRRLWQQSFYDRVLRKTEDVPAIGQYILENPVRAGLVSSVEEWPYAGGTLVGGRGGRS